MLISIIFKILGLQKPRNRIIYYTKFYRKVHSERNITTNVYKTKSDQMKVDTLKIRSKLIIIQFHIQHLQIQLGDTLYIDKVNNIHQSKK